MTSSPLDVTGRSDTSLQKNKKRSESCDEKKCQKNIQKETSQKTL